MASSWFSWLFLVCVALRGLCLVPGLVRLLGLILVGGSSGKRHIGSGRIGASSHQHMVQSTRGSAEARRGSWLTVIGSSSPMLVPGPNSLKTTRGGKVRGSPWASAHLSLRAEVHIKGISHHFWGVCVCMCVYVCPWARLTSRKLLSALFAAYTCIYCIRYSSALLCSLAPHYYCINKPQLLNVSARFVFLSLARHDTCLRISVRNLFIWSGQTLVIPLDYAGSESAIAT